MHPDYPTAAILNTHARQLRSDIVGDDYELSIFLPLSYKTSDQWYPTLYVLDSPFGFGLAASGVAWQSFEWDIPEMIVVGIGKQITSLNEWWPIRWRDYSPARAAGEPSSGSAAAFLAFIEQELTPFIEAEYRTQPGDRAIWGHSLGGAFALHAMFENPTLFKRCIVTVPALVYEGQKLLDYTTAAANASFSSENHLFVTLSTLDTTFGPDGSAFLSLLASRDIPNLKHQSAVLDGYSHTGTSVPGFFQGLSAVFSTEK